MIKIYTDGSAKNNGHENSYGGFGVIILKDNKIIYKYSEFYDNVTNNQMELKALIHAFDYIKNILNESEEFEVYSDSAYCVNICILYILTQIFQKVKLLINVVDIVIL